MGRHRPGLQTHRAHRAPALRTRTHSPTRMLEKQATATTLQELRTQQGLSMVNAARGLRLSVDVWKKFESGAIELVSLSEKQLARLASFFQLSSEQFGHLLNNSQPAFTLNRRNT